MIENVGEGENSDNSESVSESNESAETQNTSSEVDVVDVSDLAESHSNDMPEVSEFAVEAELEKQTQEDNLPKVENGDITDKYGNKFNRDVHKANDDGSAKVSDKTGRLVIKNHYKAKKLAGIVNGSPKQSVIGEIKDSSTPNSNSVSATQIDEAQEAAKEMAGLCEMGLTLVDTEFVHNEEERVSAVACWKRVFDSYGVKRTPPWVGPIALYSTIVVSRMSKPSVKKKATTIFAKAYFWCKRKLNFKKRDNYEHDNNDDRNRSSDSGPNGDR